MSVHIKKRDGKKLWYVHWYDENGGRHTKTFGEGAANERLAKAYDFDLKSAKKRKVSTLPAPNSAVMMDDLAIAYVSHCKANGKTEKWLNEVRNLLNKYWLEKLCTKPVDDMTYQDDMLPFIAHYSEHSQSTRNRYFGYLKAIFNFGVRHGITKNNPLRAWQKQRELPRSLPLTVEDLFKIHQNAEPHLKWAIEIIWNTGIRPGPKELFALKWSEHVNFERGIVRVIGKGNFYREVPMSEPFKERMLEMRAQSKSDYIVEYKGKPVKKLFRSLPTAVRRAGIEYPVCMYSIRHLFATVLLSKGADLSAVSKILGHASTKMTADTYYHLLEGEKTRAVGLIPQF